MNSTKSRIFADCAGAEIPTNVRDDTFNGFHTDLLSCARVH